MFLRCCGPLGALALSLATLACGDGTSVEPTTDAAPTIDAPSADLVTVRVVSGSQPASGIHVVFQDPTGEVLEATVSGQGGIARFELPALGMVTVVPPSAPISTFTKVQPGDELTFDVTPRGNPAGVAQVQLPAPIATANRFEVATGCGSQTATSVAAPLSFAINSSCLSSDGEMAVVALAFEVDENNNDAFVALHGVSAVRDQPVSSSGASITLPAFEAPSSNAEIALAGAILPRALIVGEVVEDIVFGRQFIIGIDPITIPVAASIADLLQLGVSWGLDPINLPGGQLVRTQISFHRFATAELGQAYNTDTDGLDPITSISLDASNLIRPVVSYVAPQAGLDLWVASVSASGQEWALIAPPGDSSVTLPLLPDYLADRWAPASADVIFAGAIAAELSEVPDYDAVRTGPGFSTYTSNNPPLGAAGSSVRASVATLVPSAGVNGRIASPKGWLGRLSALLLE